MSKAPYEIGQYVVYAPKSEIGRVTKCCADGAFVCYSQGCTASKTPYDLLRSATDKEVSEAPAGIGYHRFDDFCPSYSHEACSHLCPPTKEMRETC